MQSEAAATQMEVRDKDVVLDARHSSDDSDGDKVSIIIFVRTLIGREWEI